MAIARSRTLSVPPVEQPGSVAWASMGSVVAAAFGAGLVWYGEAVGWIFILAGGAGIAHYGRLAASRAKFGAASLQVDLPLVPGGRLSARLVIPGALAATELSVELSCVRYHEHTMRDVDRASSSSVAARILWRRSARFPLRKMARETEGVITFPLPAHLPPSDFPDEPLATGLGHYWVLKAHIELPGLDFQQRYSLPVRPA